MGEASKSLGLGDRVRRTMEDILMPLYERAELPADEKAKARAASDTFRQNDDEFQQQKAAFRKRKAEEAK